MKRDMHRSGLLAYLPNALTCLRLGLGLAFPWIDGSLRLPAVIVAGTTEYLDGAMSRHYGIASKFGRLLDPVADNVFVGSVLVTLAWFDEVSIAELLFLTTRDIAVAGVIIWLLIMRQDDRVQAMRPAMSGKVATAFQFVLLITLVAKVRAPYLLAATGLVSFHPESRAFRMETNWSSSIASTSLPSSTNCVGSPTSLQILRATESLSPVTTLTAIPWLCNALIAALADSFG